MLTGKSKLILLVILIVALSFSLVGCDNSNDVPEMATITIEAARGASWVYEDVTLNGVNYGGELPITITLDKQTYHATWITTIFWLKNSGSITVVEDGQTFIIDHSEIYSVR